MADDFVTVEREGRMRADVGGGLRGPESLRVAARLPEHPEVEIRARVALVAGVYEVVELTLRSQPAGRAVPAEVLRQLPMRTLVRRSVGPLLRSLNLGQVIAPPSGQGRGDDETLLRNTAQFFRIARVLGEPPTQEVARRFRVSRATASRRVAAARRAGYLRTDEVGAGGGPRSRLSNGS